MHDDERMGKSLQILAGKNNVKTASLYICIFVQKIVKFGRLSNYKKLQEYRIHIRSSFAKSVHSCVFLNCKKNIATTKK